MNPAAGQSFEAILLDFKKTLTPKECQDFQFVTLRDVQVTALRIQKDQENLRTVMGMHRLESFLEAMTQFGKVVEVFANSSIFVAFVWGPLKFILQVGTGRCSSACPFLPIIQTIARRNLNLLVCNISHSQSQIMLIRRPGDIRQQAHRLIHSS